MPISGDSTFARSSAQGLRRHFYEFGPYRLDALNQRLLRSGEPTAITPKTLDLLLLLVRHRERVISKRELMQELWQDTAVEEANLMQQVFVLRKLLGEGQAGGAYIETVPRRGYRFAAQAVEVREESPPARSTDVATETSAAPAEQARPVRGVPVERWRRRAGRCCDRPDPCPGSSSRIDFRAG